MPDAELAREVVAAPAGEHGHHAVAPAQLARDGAGQPVAAHRGRDLAGVAGRARQLARVLDRGRAVDAEGDAVRAQRRLDVGQQLCGAAGARGGVDDQADGAIHAAGEARRGRVVARANVNCGWVGRRGDRPRRRSLAPFPAYRPVNAPSVWRQPARPAPSLPYPAAVDVRQDQRSQRVRDVGGLRIRRIGLLARRAAGQHQSRVQPGAARAGDIDVEQVADGQHPSRPEPVARRLVHRRLGLADHQVRLAAGGVLDRGQDRAGAGPRAVGHREGGVARGADQLGAAA